MKNFLAMSALIHNYLSFEIYIYISYFLLMIISVYHFCLRLWFRSGCFFSHIICLFCEPLFLNLPPLFPPPSPDPCTPLLPTPVLHFFFTKTVESSIWEIMWKQLQLICISLREIFFNLFSILFILLLLVI